MSVIRSLIVAIRANTSGLTAPVAKATKSLGGFTSSIGKVGGALTGLTGGLTAVGAALAVVKQFSVLDELAKGATKIGATTEAFAGLKHAAELSDVPVENLISSIQRMQKTLSEGTANDLFARMGMDPAKLKSLPTEEIFARIAGGIASIENPADRAAAAMEVFGKSGAQMLPLLNEGAEGIRAFIEEAKQLGFAFSEVDASKIEAANDAITTMKNAFGGLAAQLAIDVAPAITEIAKEIIELVKRWAEFRGDISNDVDLGSPISKSAMKTASAERMEARLKEMQKVADNVNKFRQRANEGARTRNFSDDPLGIAQGVWERKALRSTQTLEDIAEERSRLMKRLRNMPTPFDAKANEAWKKGQAEEAKRYEAYLNEIKKRNALANSLIAQVKAEADTFGMSPEQAALHQAQAAGADKGLIDQARKEIARLEALKKNVASELAAADAMKAANERGKEQAQALIDAADRWKDAIETPAETFAKKAQEIADLVRGGLLSDAEGNKALEQAAGMTDKPAGERRFSEALVAGSAAAVSAMNRAAFGGDQTDPTQKKLQEQLNVAKAQLAGIKASERLLEEMAANEADEPVANF